MIIEILNASPVLLLLMSTCGQTTKSMLLLQQLQEYKFKFQILFYFSNTTKTLERKM